MQEKTSKNRIRLVIIFLIVIVVASLFYFRKPSEKTTDEVKLIEDLVASSIQAEQESGNVFHFNNILFSLPSPYQISLILHESGISYNKELLNPSRKASDYVTNFNRAINFGVYGVDLGYINIYQQTQDAASYFAVLKILSLDLGIYKVLNQSTVNRIEANIDNRDSLMVIVSETYRNIDKFLKTNEREETGALILAGGWIESVYILTQEMKNNPHPDLMQRIAEQKRPLENLIKLLIPNTQESESYKYLVENLIQLAYTFDEIVEEYEYIPSIDYPKKKLTVVNSKSKLIITPELTSVITYKIDKLHTFITQ
ncbi:hypothetical protein DWB61_15755 [Ancylomarina euxinus]|uniref:Uncharacterized protein n=1 Tax=Ancylomarina euxinus TaxID=2283627 RepID=A0A425XXG8_9BACT|nr:hypothetical protein [Ancylomarina euxinus]MCZ4696078.1 hypothetical protein [Ancylomarina euxinus]MUP16487.1 hypothetical protein [Ancylomarina euxinus]RRG19358.1 hypothetical protein DWB61_15755 [Ancylomarina euxinus]